MLQVNKLMLLLAVVMGLLVAVGCNKDEVAAEAPPPTEAYQPATTGDAGAAAEPSKSGAPVTNEDGIIGR